MNSDLTVWTQKTEYASFSLSPFVKVELLSNYCGRLPQRSSPIVQTCSLTALITGHNVHQAFIGIKSQLRKRIMSRKRVNLWHNAEFARIKKSPHIQSTLVISTSVISNNRLSRRENLVLVLTQKSKIRLQNIVKKRRNCSWGAILPFSTIFSLYISN